MSTTERRAAKTSTSACQTTAAATAYANASTRMDPASVTIAQLHTATRERRAADAGTRALQTVAKTRANIITAAATSNANAP